MTVRISSQPFTDQEPTQWHPLLLGPAWVHIEDGGFTFDVPMAYGVHGFVEAALEMAQKPYAYGTVYAVRLDGSAVTEGPWHYDLGEYREDGAVRYVTTWASDGVPLQNVFQEDGRTLQPENNYVVEFNEGTDYHRREAVHARPGQWGVFASLALYLDHEPANLDCPRISELESRGDRGIQAREHSPVARKLY